MARTLEGKAALVTGGSRGIGRAIVERLAADGATLVINYARNKTQAQELVNSITAGGGKATAILAAEAVRARDPKARFHAAFRDRLLEGSRAPELGGSAGGEKGRREQGIDPGRGPCTAPVPGHVRLDPFGGLPLELPARAILARDRPRRGIQPREAQRVRGRHDEVLP